MSMLEIPCYAFNARHASRHLSQFYERLISGSGIRGQQFTVLAIIKKKGPINVIALAEELAMDRTTLARSLGPLERDGYLSISKGEKDQRIKVIALTDHGTARLEEAVKLWRQAQTEFESRFGVERAAKLREELRAAADAVSFSD